MLHSTPPYTDDCSSRGKSKINTLLRPLWVSASVCLMRKKLAFITSFTCSPFLSLPLLLFIIVIITLSSRPTHPVLYDKRTRFPGKCRVSLPEDSESPPYQRFPYFSRIFNYTVKRVFKKAMLNRL